MQPASTPSQKGGKFRSLNRSLYIFGIALSLSHSVVESLPFRRLKSYPPCGGRTRFGPVVPYFPGTSFAACLLSPPRGITRRSSMIHSVRGRSTSDDRRVDYRS